MELNVINNKNFLKRNWWGLSCLFFLFVSLGAGLGHDKMPSSSLNGIVFFAKAESDSILYIKNPPEKFHVQITGQEDLHVEKLRIVNNITAFKITHKGDLATIQGLSPELNIADIEKQWDKDPVSIDHQSNGSYRIKSGFDIPGNAINGIYEVRGNLIFGHYFESGRLLIAFSGFILVLPLYLAGKFCGWVKRKIKP